jgi:two-component system, LytTR family, sensor kinase
MDKLATEQRSRQKEMEVLKLNKDLATWQITAMRAQMNPHFIFNAMNSIQQFTLKNDTDNANLYISKFSTLLRKVLHTSEQNNISLEEEMEQLQLYLDIEKLRMGDDFVYSITADAEIEADALKMPGMLVQPFVENAVKHGLSLKEGEKKLTIHFFMPDEHHLHVMVIDNGIGRQRSAELKQQQTLMPHISKGIQLVEERLLLLEQNKDHRSAIFINDLPDGSGTQVTVVIPVF